MKTAFSMVGARTSNSVSRKRSGVGRVSCPGSVFKRRLRNSPPITRIASPHLHQAVAALPMFANVVHGAAELFGPRRIVDERLRFAARYFEQLLIANDIADAQRRQPGLAGAEEFAGTAQFQIHFGDVETVA